MAAGDDYEPLSPFEPFGITDRDLTPDPPRQPPPPNAEPEPFRVAHGGGEHDAIRRQTSGYRTAGEQGSGDAHERDVVEVERVANNLRGCLPTAMLGALGLIAVLVWAVGGGNDPFGENAAGCNASGVPRGGLVLIAAQDCDTDDAETTTTATTATTTTPAGVASGAPAPEDVPAGSQLFEGTSGGEIGCITCDGASRFINITNSTTAAGDAARPGQEIVWPEDGRITDFGVDISGPNEGRYGFALFLNGTAYSNGCTLEIGQTSCRMDQQPAPLQAGDRVTIIVGEGGTLNQSGRPASVGNFTASWWFVFQPD